MKKLLPAILTLFIGFFASLFFLSNKPQNVSAAAADYVVISEVQIGGAGAGTSGNDFVELYNPTSLAISLANMRLGKKTSGTSSASVVAFEDDDSIPARGYFLWCNTSLSGSLSCDASGSGTVANDNSLALINGSLLTGTVVDAVSFGTPGATFGEGTSLNAPAGGTSVERKANSTSTDVSMGPGGVDELAGNGEDSDNNASDFVNRTLPQPQNSLSATEPLGAPSPTTQPSPSVEPTIEPSVEPSPTTEPSPTSTPTPSLEPSPVLSPAPTLSPTPSVPAPHIIARGPLFTCTLNYKPWKLFNKTFFFPFVHCVRTVSN